MDNLDQSTIAVLGLGVSITVATLGWIFAFISKRIHDSRAAQLDRVNRQLKDLYGPLYIILEAGGRVWESFWFRHRPAHGKSYYFGEDVTVTESEKETWLYPVSTYGTDIGLV